MFRLVQAFFPAQSTLPNSPKSTTKSVTLALSSATGKCIDVANKPSQNNQLFCFVVSRSYGEYSLTFATKLTHFSIIFNRDILVFDCHRSDLYRNEEHKAILFLKKRLDVGCLGLYYFCVQIFIWSLATKGNLDLLNS